MSSSLFKYTPGTSHVQMKRMKYLRSSYPPLRWQTARMELPLMVQGVALLAAVGVLLFLYAPAMRAREVGRVLFASAVTALFIHYLH